MLFKFDWNINLENYPQTTNKDTLWWIQQRFYKLGEAIEQKRGKGTRELHFDLTLNNEAWYGWKVSMKKVRNVKIINAKMRGNIYSAYPRPYHLCVGRYEADPATMRLMGIEPPYLDMREIELRDKRDMIVMLAGFTYEWVGRYFRVLSGTPSHDNCGIGGIKWIGDFRQYQSERVASTLMGA